MATCTCVLTGEGVNGANGTLKLSQASEDAPTKIEGTIKGLTPGSKHGISINVWGDLTDGGNSCGPIFNPFGKSHGAPTDDATLRMVGSLGNITADENGIGIVSIEDTMVKIYGPHSIVGRSMVIYAGQDDSGRGGQENSLTTGNSGPRIACGVIGLSSSSSS